jgi:hypothetical protein
LSFAVGLALLAGLLAWLALEIFRALLRLAGERTRQQVALEKLRAQLLETRLRCREAEQAQAGWNGLRKFTVVKKKWRMRRRPRVLSETARRPAAARVQARPVSHVPA